MVRIYSRYLKLVSREILGSEFGVGSNFYTVESYYVRDIVFPITPFVKETRI